MKYSEKVYEILEPFRGAECCRQYIGKIFDLNIGFGDKIYHQNKRSVTDYYGALELGTYSANWSIFDDERLLLNSILCRENNYKNNSFPEIKFGNFDGLEFISDEIVRLKFSNDFSILFEQDKNIEDDLIHFFTSDFCGDYTVGIGWQYEKR